MDSNDFCWLDLSAFYHQYQWEIWKNIAGKSDSFCHGGGGEDIGDSGVAAGSGSGHSGGDDVDDGGGGGGPLK